MHLCLSELQRMYCEKQWCTPLIRLLRTQMPLMQRCTLGVAISLSLEKLFFVLVIAAKVQLNGPCTTRSSWYAGVVKSVSQKYGDYISCQSAAPAELCYKLAEGSLQDLILRQLVSLSLHMLLQIFIRATFWWRLTLRLCPCCRQQPTSWTASSPLAGRFPAPGASLPLSSWTLVRSCFMM